MCLWSQNAQKYTIGLPARKVSQLCTHHAAGDDHHVADERLVGLGRLRQARNVLTGQDKEVRGRLRCDIAVEGS